MVSSFMWQRKMGAIAGTGVQASGAVAGLPCGAARTRPRTARAALALGRAAGLGTAPVPLAGALALLAAAGLLDRKSVV